MARYNKYLAMLHWLIATTTLGGIFAVLTAQRVEEKEEKIKYMQLHKSFGLLTGALMIPRVGLRLTTKIPTPFAESLWERVLASFTHHSLYGLLVGLPISGLIMGYFDGRGAPFFGLFRTPHIENPTKGDKDLAELIWAGHKLVGKGLELLIGLHLVGNFYHIFKGQNILRRMDPRRPPGMAGGSQ